MSKTFKAGLAATAMFTALAAAAAPITASAMPQANGITNCDAPGGRQRFVTPADVQRDASAAGPGTQFVSCPKNCRMMPSRRLVS